MLTACSKAGHSDSRPLRSRLLFAHSDSNHRLRTSLLHRSPATIPRSSYRFFPPELCFGYLPSTKSDIWQLACILYQIHTKAVLFPTVFQIFEILIGTIVSYLGPIPQRWKGKFNFDEYGYCEPGQVQDTTEPEWWFEDKCSEKTIDSRITQEAVHLSTHQREEYVRLLHDMVAYEPEKRLSAVEVIQRLRSASFLDEDSSELVNRR